MKTKLIFKEKKAQRNENYYNTEKHAAWQATQPECPHLWRTHSHVSQGT